MCQMLTFETQTWFWTFQRPQGSGTICLGQSITWINSCFLLLHTLIIQDTVHINLLNCSKMDVWFLEKLLHALLRELRWYYMIMTSPYASLNQISSWALCQRKLGHILSLNVFPNRKKLNKYNSFVNKEKNLCLFIWRMITSTSIIFCINANNAQSNI